MKPTFDFTDSCWIAGVPTTAVRGWLNRGHVPFGNAGERRTFSLWRFGLVDAVKLAAMGRLHAYEFLTREAGAIVEQAFAQCGGPGVDLDDLETLLFLAPRFVWRIARGKGLPTVELVDAERDPVTGGTRATLDLANGEEAAVIFDPRLTILMTAARFMLAEQNPETPYAELELLADQELKEAA